MTKIRTLLLGTAAGLLAIGGAQAADMPVKAAPVNYVKICSLYGDGFYYIPGTDTCLKLGGYLRVQAETHMGGGGVPIGDSAGGEAPQGVWTRDRTNDINYRVRGVTSWDVRQQTEYGTLRTLHPVRRGEHHAGCHRRRHDLQPLLGSRVHAVCGLHGGPVAVVLRPLHLRRRLQLPQRARLRRYRRLRPEPLGLHRPVRQRLLRHAVAGRPRDPQGRYT